MLVSVLTMILIHDIHPSDIRSHDDAESDHAPSKQSSSDHSEGCEDACPCVIHVLEKSSNYGLSESTIFNPCSLYYIIPEHKHESIVPETIDRPPKA